MFVYIVSNHQNTVFYTGVTNDIRRRMYEHKSGLQKGFTKKYRCDVLLYYREIADPDEAIAFEKSLKKFRRSAKQRLIGSVNPGFSDLSADWESGELKVPLLYKPFMKR